MRYALTALFVFAAPAFAQAPSPEVDVGAVTTPTPAPAAAPDPAAQALLAAAYNGLTFDELEAIVKAGGYGYKRQQASSGPYIETGTARGVSYEIWLSQCEQEGGAGRCTGINLQTLYFKESPKVTLKALNDWNVNAWGVRAALFSNGQSGVVMNIGVTGVTGQWVLDRMSNFNYWADVYNEFWVTGNPAATPAPAQ